MAERGGLLHPDVEDYTAKETQDEVARGALLIDVREPSEWQAGHIPDAKHIPMGQIAHRIAELPRDRKIIFTCRSGNRSGTIKDYMIDEHGYTDVHNQLGGILAWQVEGLPVIK
ncbi:MAG TPA: rhodanese-like domain-containing protein [Candidatus Eremiobacteraceae bacterium]|jgi:rhodanese-related sulfurtransferase|nr:rhodanese-like domain-containing protein [Candidatus Eremiobacteraceae bacterium]